jgi:hypothetical protein
VHNIECQRSNTALHEQVDYNASSSFAILWSLVHALLPDVIFDNFNDFIQSLGPDVRMDGNGALDSDATGKGTYHIKFGNLDFVFHGAELAPPCGVMAKNYCRQV